MRKLVVLFAIMLAVILLSVPTLYAQLSGTKTIGGTSPDYATVKEAFKDLNAKGVTSPGVTFLIRGGTYNEDSLRIRTSTAGPSSPVLVQPDSGSTVVINVTPPNSTYNFGIAIDTTHSVTITGKPFKGQPTDRNLSLNVLGANGFVGIRVVGNSDNCKLENLIIATASLTNSNSRAIYLYATGSSIVQIPDYAVISNNYIKKAQTGIRAQGGEIPNLMKGLLVSNNQIATSVGDSVGAIGISVSSIDSAVITGNTIRNIFSPSSGGASTLSGLLVENYAQSTLVHKNIIAAMKGGAATTNVYGLNIANYITATNLTGSGAKYFNNLIYGLDGVANGTGTIAGIYVSSGSIADSIYHNSVLLTGTSSGQRISTAFYYNGANMLVVRNNSFVNRRTETGGLNSFASALYIGSASATGFASDNNNLFPGNGGDSTYCAVVWRISSGLYKKFSTLGGSQYEFGNDIHSVVENAPYVSDTDLHLVPGSTTQLESAGAPIPASLKNDFDSAVRNETTPDIGAFEGTFTRVDGMPPVFTSFIPLPPAPRAGARTVVISIFDLSGVAAGANEPKLMWKKSTDTVYTPVSASSVSDYVFTFSIPEQPIRTVVQYYFTARDGSPSANFGTLPPRGTPTAAPPTVFSYLVQDPISGVKTVGGLTPDYLTLKAAIKDINAQDVVPPGVTLLIRTGIYNEDSLRIYTMKSNPTAPILIQPDSAATVVINVTPPSSTYNFGLAIDTTQSVTITGQPRLGLPTERNLTINVLGTNGLVGVRVTGGSFNTVVRNLTISTGAVLTNSSGRGIMVTYGYISPNYGIPHYPVIDNNYIKRAYTGISVSSVNSANSLKAPQITNNIIGTGATDSLGAIGIALAASDSAIIFKNTVRNILPPTGGATALYGMQISSDCNWTDVSHNSISKIRGIGTSGTVTGMFINNTQTKACSRYYNNVISDVEGLASGTGIVAGIYISGLSTSIPDSFFYNSVLLTGTSTGSRISAALAFAPFSSGYQLYLRNNNFVNRRTEVNGLNSFAAGMYIGYPSQVINSDHNNFNAGPAVDTSHLVIAYKANTSSPNYYRKFTKLGGWQYEFGKDMNSVSENAPFVSVSDLHLPPSSATHLESNGTPVSVKLDFDGNVRNLLTPDIGAFEGTYTQVDSMPPTFSHIPLLPTPTTGSRVVQVTIKDPSGLGVAANAPKLWYKAKDSVNYIAVGIDSANGTVYNFTIPGWINNTTVQYYFSAKDASPAQNFSTWPPMGTPTTAPPVVYSYLVQTPLPAGTYTVGVGKNFPTLDSLCSKISKEGVTGSVTALLTDTLYNVITLSTLSGPINGTGPTQRITIKPDSGKTVTIATSLAYALRLLDASNVTIDGVNSEGSSLYFNTTGAAGIQLEGNSDNNIIQNTKFRANQVAINFTAADAAKTPDNNLIQNNLFTKANVAVYLMNVSNNTIPVAYGNRITNNRFDYFYLTLADSMFNTAAVQVNNAIGTWVDNNIIKNIYNNVTIARPAGIATSNFIQDTRIFNNTISKIVHPNSYDVSACYGINLDAKSGVRTHTLVYNNMIYDIDDRTQGNGLGSIGIKAGTGQNDTIAYNTVLLTDSTGWRSIAMNSTWSTDPNRTQVWLNNIGINLRRPFLKNAMSAAFAIDDSLNMNIVANNNNWYSLNLPNMFVAGYSYGALYTSLADWQKRGRDPNSISVNANFRSATDLHIDSAKATLIYAGGIPVAGITDDIDGQTRNQFKPCIGADEFIGMVAENDIGVTAIQRLVSNDTLRFRVIVRNYGASPQPTYTVKYTGDTTVISGTLANTRPLLVGASDTLFFVWPKPSQGAHVLKAWTVLANDQDQLNDTAIANIYVSTGWTLNVSGTTNTLESVKALSDKIAWAAGIGPKVLRTTDGGTTWNSISTSSIPGSIYNIEAINENIAMVTSNPSNQPAQIFRTTNAGSTWTSVFSEVGGFIDAIKMYNTSGGYAVGDPVSKAFTVLKTTNGGATWDRTAVQPSRLTTQTQPEYGLNNCLFVFGSSNIWFGTSYGRVIRSTDGGASWEAAQTPINGEIDRVIFNGTKFGVAGGLDALVRTTDGGVTWNPVSTGGSGFVLGLGCVGNTFWAAQGTNVYVSFDLGKTWLSTYVGSNYTIRDLSFVGSTNYIRGWGVGENGMIVSYLNTWTGIDDPNAGIPTVFALDQNFPNPFNPTTSIRFALPVDSKVNLKVYDILGREIATLVKENMPAGYHSIQWNGRNNFNQAIASGVYIYRIEAGSFIATKKMMMLK